VVNRLPPAPRGNKRERERERERERWRKLKDQSIALRKLEKYYPKNIIYKGGEGRE